MLVTVLFVELVCDAGMIKPDECEMFFKNMGGPGYSGSDSEHHDHSESGDESGSRPKTSSEGSDSEENMHGFVLE